MNKQTSKAANRANGLRVHVAEHNCPRALEEKHWIPEDGNIRINHAGAVSREAGSELVYHRMVAQELLATNRRV